MKVDISSVVHEPARTIKRSGLLDDVLVEGRLHLVYSPGEEVEDGGVVCDRLALDGYGLETAPCGADRKPGYTMKRQPWGSFITGDRRGHCISITVALFRNLSGSNRVQNSDLIRIRHVTHDGIPNHIFRMGGRPVRERPRASEGACCIARRNKKADINVDCRVMSRYGLLSRMQANREYYPLTSSVPRPLH